MKKLMLLVGLLGAGQTVYQAGEAAAKTETAREVQAMGMGAFSVSLSVKDLATSKEFYSNLGFEQIGGKDELNYLILQNGAATIGLFQGMFEGNILTFNPGWDSKGKDLPGEFADVREIQRQLESKGIELATKADESTEGPASFTLLDPDGNAILVDQHR